MPRIALLIHCVRQATGDLTDDAKVDAESIADAITLVRWFGREAKRVYAMLNESDEESDHRRLVEWIQGRGGRATARDVQRNLRSYPTVDDAEAALKALAEAGYGVRRPYAPPGEQGGRPTMVFELIGDAIADRTPENIDNG